MAWGGARPTPDLPLPPYAPRSEPVPVRIESGFFTDLPPRSITFFERELLVPFRRPTIFDPQQPISRQLNFPIGAFRVNRAHVLVIRELAFQAFRAGTIDPNASIPIAEGGLATFLGYTVDIENHGPKIDHQNSVDGPGGVVQNTLPLGANVASAYPSIYGQVHSFSESGSFRRRFGRQFALYAGSEQLVKLGYSVLRPPPVEVTLVFARCEGWMLPSQIFDAIVAKNQGTR